MNSITLRVFNNLSELGISEEEFLDIEREEKTDNKGLYIAKVLKDGRSVCVCHDEKHKIQILNIPKAKKGRVLFKTLITFDVPKEIYTLHSIFQYRASDSEIKHIADNIEQLKERMFQRFADGYPKQLGAIYDDAYGDYDERKKAERWKHDIVVEQLKAIFWVFNDEYKDQEFKSRLNVDTIVKVWEHNNCRIALFQEKDCSEVLMGGFSCHQRRDVDRIVYKIKSYTPKDKEYNYVDVGREVGLCENHDNFNEIWITDELIGKVVEDFGIIQNIAKNQDWWLLTPDRYADIQKDIINLNNIRQREEVQRQAKNQLIKNIDEQFEKGKVVRHGITFTPTYFEYEGIRISGENIDEYLVRNQILFQERPDFIKIFHNYIVYNLCIRKESWGERVKLEVKTTDFKVGKIDINVNSTTKGVWVNDFKISKDEVDEVVFNAINFKNQVAYNDFLEETNRVSLKLKRVLEKGVFEFEVRLDSYDCPIKFKENRMVMVIPIIRENNKNYIIVKKNKFPIKNIGAFFNLKKSRNYAYDSDLDRIISQIYKAVNKLSVKDIADMISDGIKRYKQQLILEAKIEAEKVKRSKEFIENAVRITKAVRKDKGYIVKGISGTNYYVDDECKVYTIDKKTGKTDRYICIVDGEYGSAKWQINDRIAKRLLMLSKDLKVADEVHTLFEKSGIEPDEDDEDEYEEEVEI